MTESNDKERDIFKDMHQQMTPDPEVLEALAQKIAREQDNNCHSAGGSAASQNLKGDSTNPPLNSATPLRSAQNDSYLDGSVAPKKRRRPLSIAFAAAASVVVLAVGVMAVLPMLNQAPSKDTALAPATATAGSTSKSTQEQVWIPDSYAELLENLKPVDFVYDVAPLSLQDDSSASMDSGSEAGMTGNPESAPDAAAPSPTAPLNAPLTSEQADPSAKNTSEATTAGGADFSETNTQVADVDEGDVVKTDGKHIYILHQNEVIIALADGENSQEVARFYPQEGAVVNDYTSINATDLYINGDTLAVLYDYYDYDAKQPRYGYYNANASTRVAFFDVSDAGAPQALHVLGQDGSLRSSRVYDGVLYVVSDYWVASFAGATGDTPELFVPRLYSDDGGVDSSTQDDSDAVAPERVLALDEICVLPYQNGNVYTVVSSVALGDAQRIDSRCILGQAETVYMSTDNLYVVGREYQSNTEVTPKNSDVELVTDTFSTSSHITRFALDKGSISVAAGAAVPGGLLNQFSLDQYDGYLRVALTREESVSTYPRSTNPDKPLVPTNPGEASSSDYSYSNSQTNALLVLDASLNVVGSVEGLAADERIYSVRFDGPLGYMVTFRQTDPLFTIDLSDPANPQVLSALKIPGFSNYLHVYTPGRLLGLGKQADENTGRAGGLKLSMFDTANPFDVTEKSKLELAFEHSAALDNHKAVLINSEHDLIGFEAWRYSQNVGSSAGGSVGGGYGYQENYYLIYGYSDEQGFVERAAIKLPVPESYYTSNTRGLYVGDYLYISSGAYLGVYDLDTLTEVAWIELPVSEPSYQPPRALYLID